MREGELDPVSKSVGAKDDGNENSTWTRDLARLDRINLVFDGILREDPASPSDSRCCGPERSEARARTVRMAAPEY